MMKKLLAIILTLVVILSLCACGHTHEFGEWTIVKKATCLETGSKNRTCECGEIETEEISISDHNFNETATIKAVTCEEDGESEMTCTVCGLVENKIIPAAGHNFEPATNYKPSTCTACGATQGEALAKVVNVGEVAESENHSFVIKKIYFTKEPKVSNGWLTQSYMDGHYLAIKMDFTNLSTETFSDWGSSRVTEMSLDYMDKYMYEGEYWVPSYDIVPLDNDIVFILYSVPELMAKDTENPIYATFTIDDEVYAVIVNEGTEN